MINKTFKTLFKKPIILIGFAILLILPTVIYIPLSFVFANDSCMDFSPTATHSEADMSNFGTSFILITAAVLCVTIAFAVFGYSPLTHYIGEVCQGTDSKGWYKRGLKKCWWRLIVYVLISYASILVLFLISVLLVVALKFFGVILYFIIIIGWSVLLILGINAVIIEDKFGTGLINIFKVGIRYFFKTLGVLIVAYIPLIALSSLLATNMFNTISYSVQPTMDFYLNMGVLYWVITIISLIYSVFFVSFTSIYNSYNYIEYRKVYVDSSYDEQPLTENSQDEMNAVITEDTADLDEPTE